MVVRVHRRGIVLISILVLTLLTTLFIGALLQMNPGRLRQTLHEERHDLASAAAKAGAEYALERLVEDPDWKGQGSEMTVQTDQMVVREDRGNVFGWIRAEGGEWAGFTIRFNYQDGDGGDDSLDQPTRPIRSRAISLNNLAGDSSARIPLGTGPDFQYEGKDGFDVPEHSVALLVEGFVGPGVAPDGAGSGTTSTSPVDPASSSEVTTRTLEGIYQISGYAAPIVDGSVFMAGGDSRFTVGDAPKGTETDRGDEEFRGVVRLMATDQVASMRTKGTSRLSLAPGKVSPYNFYPDLNSEVRVGETAGFSPITKAGQDYTLDVEEPNDALLEVAWEKVATSTQAGRLKLPAGVYTVDGGSQDSTDTSRVKYYPLTFAEYRTELAAGRAPVSSEVPEGFMDKVQLNGKEWTNPDGNVEKRDLITFDSDVEVTTVGENADFAIVPAGGAKQKAISDLNEAVNPTSFGQLPAQKQNDSDVAILAYLTKNESPGSYTFQVGSQSITYNKGSDPPVDFTGLGDGVLTKAALTGSPITPPPGLSLSSLPGAEVRGTALLQPNPYQGTLGTAQMETLWEVASSEDFRLTNPTSFLSAVNDVAPLPTEVLETNIDPLEVPESADLDDDTEPQDLEVTFAPSKGKSAAIRAGGSVLLATHLSGNGGAVVAGKNINIVGLGVDLNSGSGERDGISLYAQNDINLSTYDKKRNKYWDASIKGVVFAKGDMNIRMGETVPQGALVTEPSWGTFDLLGSMIVLGDAPAYVVNPTVVTSGTKHTGHEGPDGTGTGETDPSPTTSAVGNANLIARGIRLFYEPKFLAPLLTEQPSLPVFSAVSVVER